MTISQITAQIRGLTNRIKSNPNSLASSLYKIDKGFTGNVKNIQSLDITEELCCVGRSPCAVSVKETGPSGTYTVYEGTDQSKLYIIRTVVSKKNIAYAKNEPAVAKKIKLIANEADCYVPIPNDMHYLISDAFTNEVLIGSMLIDSSAPVEMLAAAAICSQSPNTSYLMYEKVNGRKLSAYIDDGKTKIDDAFIMKVIAAVDTALDRINAAVGGQFYHGYLTVDSVYISDSDEVTIGDFRNSSIMLGSPNNLYILNEKDYSTSTLFFDPPQMGDFYGKKYLILKSVRNAPFLGGPMKRSVDLYTFAVSLLSMFKVFDYLMLNSVTAAYTKLLSNIWFIDDISVLYQRISHNAFSHKHDYETIIDHVTDLKLQCNIRFSK